MRRAGAHPPGGDRGCRTLRKQEVQEAREQREEQRHQEAAREAKLDLDREESKRRYEERLTIERAEARER
jgi:hypothetical protein